MSFESTENTDKLDAALAKAQGEMRAAKKTKKNPHFGSMYADLDDVVDAVRDTLSKYGIAYTQWPLTSETNKLKIMTRLACEGQWMRSTFELPLSKQDAQGYGSALTYAKRYGLSAAVGVSSDECDDANAAVGKEKKDPPAKPPQGNVAPPKPVGPAKGPATKPTPKPAEPPRIPDPSEPPPGEIELISEAQRKRLFALASERGMLEADLKKICAGFGITTRAAIPISKYDALIRKVEEFKK